MASLRNRAEADRAAAELTELRLEAGRAAEQRTEADLMKAAAQREAAMLRERAPADVIFDSLDSNHDGALSRQEFLSGMSHLNRPADDSAGLGAGGGGVY